MMFVRRASAVIAALCFALCAMGEARAQTGTVKTQSQLNAEIGANFCAVAGCLIPDQTQGQVTPFNIRQVMLDLTASAFGQFGTYTPEQYGATGGPDDTAAFVAMCSAISAAGGHATIQMSPGRIYTVWPTTPAQQSILCNLSNSVSIRWNFNGAQFNVAYTGTATTYIIFINGSSQIEINDLNGIAASGKHVAGDNTGVTWVTCSNQGGAGFGCTKLAVRRASVNGALQGVAIIRTLGTGAFSHDIWVDGFFLNVGYPVSNQNDGLNTSFDIITNNAGRSYIGYNVWGVRGRINSITGNSLNDVEVAAYGFQGDISQNRTVIDEITYINRASTNYGSSLLTLSHQQGDPNHSNIATTITAKFRFDVLFNGAPSGNLFQENSFVGNGSSQSAGDPGNTNDNIVFEGKVEGDIGSSYLGCLMAASNGNCAGYNGTSKGTYNLSNLQIPASTKPWAIGKGATVTFQNYSSPNAGFPTFDAGYDFGALTIRQPVVFSNGGAEPIQGTLNFVDLSGALVGWKLHSGIAGFFYRNDDTFVGGIGAAGGQITVSGTTGFGVGLAANNTLAWNVVSPSGNFVPNLDNTYAIGIAGLRLSDIQSVTGTFGGLLTWQAGSLATNIAAPSTPAAGKTAVYTDSTTKLLAAKNDAGTVSITVVPATLAAHNFVNQISSGGAVLGAQPAFSDLTGSATCAQLPALTGDVTTSAGSCTTALGNIPNDTTMAGDVLATNSAAPSSPASGKTRIYVDSTSKNIAAKNDAGTVNHGIQTRAATASNWIRAINDDGSTAISQPACGDLSNSTSACSTTPAALTSNNDTNVTITLGGTPATSLLQAVSLTMGWTGQLGLTRGGTNNSLTASNGGIVWSDASKLNILAGTATANQMLQSGASATPAWSTNTWPATNAQGDLIYGSAANVLSTLAKNTTATRYLANTGTNNNPNWDQVNLANGVTGTLPVANGGTGDTGTAWTTYTPTLSCGTGTLTSASATGRSKTLGKTIFVTIVVTITTNGTCAVVLRATLPVNAQAANTYAFAGFSSGPTSGLAISDDLVSRVQILGTGGSYPGADGLTLIVTGVYESS